MDSGDRLALGIFVLFVGGCILAPKETSNLLEAIAKSENKQKEISKPSLPLGQKIIAPTQEKVGLIRTCSRGIASGWKRFCKWIY